MVEPLFDKCTFTLQAGRPATYEHTSDGSGKKVTVHFCKDCGTTLYHLFDRFPDQIGIFAGTFDDPAWFDRNADNTDYMFLDAAPRGTMVPAGYRTYSGHCRTLDGSPVEPTRLQRHKMLD